MSVARKLEQLHAPLSGVLLTAFLALSPMAIAQSSEQEILDAVTVLFDAMRSKDAEALRDAFLPEGRLGTESTEGWISSVSSSEAYLDEVTFDETVLIDDNVAMAWTPYNLFVNNEFHHCGIDLFSFRKVDGQWKILQIDDTRRTEGCDPERRGN
ncbi:nuclear transport factor 2 family protein [Congregibacter sp.]|uniref:nuclear transport factor 2 family protein n=1 Tax=Congregibacter sp. TaxID=2744308 RepID=UPI003F6B8811